METKINKRKRTTMRKIITHLIYFILITNIAYAQPSEDVFFNYLNKINLESKTAIIEAQTKIDSLEETTTIEVLIQLHEKCLVAAQKIENDSLYLINIYQIIR